MKSVEKVANYRQVQTELPTFIKEYQEFLYKKNGFKTLSFRIIDSIVRFSTIKLQKQQVELMAEQSRAWLSSQAKLEVKNFLEEK